jgi:ribosomal protein uS17
MADENVNETEENESAPEETSAEETVAEAAEEVEAEAPADEEPAEAESPSAEADAAVPAAEEAAAATEETAAEPTPAAQSGPKSKRKRLPRSQRRVRAKPKREAPAERKPIVRLEKPEHERGRRQERQGMVVSDAMEKTIVVRVDVVKAHPRYKKVVRRSVKFHAHDEQNQAKVGDVVRIVETRPLSKTKRWRLAEVVEAAK